MFHFHYGNVPLRKQDRKKEKTMLESSYKIFFRGHTMKLTQTDSLAVGTKMDHIYAEFM